MTRRLEHHVCDAQLELIEQQWCHPMTAMVTATKITVTMNNRATNSLTTNPHEKIPSPIHKSAT
jgi:hypothetical protein